MADIENTNPTRPVRTGQPNPKYHDFYQFLLSEEQKFKDITIQEYDHHESELITNILTNLKNNVNHQQNCHTQTFGLKQVIKRFGSKGKAAAEKEKVHLHNRKLFTPILPHKITSTERKRSMNTLVFFTEKRDGTIETRVCANGSTQRSYIERYKAANPTVSTEALMITSVIEAKQKRDVVTLDIPNAFIQTPIPESNEKTITRISGHLSEVIIESLPQHYKKYVIGEGNTKTIYVQMLKALYMD